MQTQEAKPCVATSGEIQAFEGSIGADRLPESGEGLHWHRCGKAGKSQARVGSGGVSGFTGIRVCVCVCGGAVGRNYDFKDKLMPACGGPGMSC